jgi:peptide/nickel transport system substrate-binding protein
VPRKPSSIVLLLALSLLANACGPAPPEAAVAPTTPRLPVATAIPGKVLSLTLDAGRDREREVQMIARHLRQVGIETEVQVWEYSSLVEEARAGNRQAYATDWGSSTFTPIDLANPKLKTGERGNFSQYSSVEVDTLLQLGATITDEIAARNAYLRVQDIVFRDAPWIFGYCRDSIEAASARVRSWRPSTDNFVDLREVASEGSGTLAVGLRSDRFRSLDPADYRDRDTETVIRNMFDGLVTRDRDGVVQPLIASSWSMPDDRSYVFQLRQGVKFHNGDALTADDVVFTFQRIMAKDGVGGRQSPRVGLLGTLEKVEKQGDYTVKMTLGFPSPAFLQLLVHTQIVPREYYERVGFDGFGRAPVGAGPFRLSSAQLSREVVLERFDGYWNGPPSLERAIFRPMPDAAVRLAALKAGEVHIVNEVPPDAVPGLEGDPNIQVKVAKGTRLYQLELNNQKIWDVRVREALNYAVNWDEILGQLYRGYAHRVSTAFLPSGFGYNPDLKPYPYDPEKARALLGQAGYSSR